MSKPVAIITGGTRGIGKAISGQLAEVGYDLIVNHVSPATTSLQETVQKLRAAGIACEPVQADISVGEDRSRLVKTTQEIYGRCDLLVNNAGVAPVERMDILETTTKSYRRVMAINLEGPFFLTQRIANWMIQQRSKRPDQAFRIVNISSISAYTSSLSRGEYCLSKAGMSMMTALYADRLAQEGIGVFEIRPGITQTDMTGSVKEKYDKLIAEGLTPIRRWGHPNDVAQAVQAIAEGRLDFCPGQVINVDGGFHLRRL